MSINYINEYTNEKININKRQEASARKYERIVTEFFGTDNPSLDQIQSITSQDIVDWLDGLNQAINTVNQKLNAVKCFYGFMNDMYDIKNPAKRIANRREEVIDNEESVKFLEKCDIDKLLETLNKNWHDNNYLRDLALIQVALYCGVRISEAASLTIDDIDFNNNELTVVGKRNKRRVIPMNSEIMTTLEKYIRVERITDKLFHITTMAISNVMKKWVAKSGISQEYTYHSLRHTFASTLAANNVPSKTIQTLLGHSSLATTEGVYIHTTRDSKHDAVNTLVK